ncbi:MAG: metalloregulator ArsR/SmtB family transcription factor [Parvibaculum sp.]|nr:metalloregulator ArsR/SmtB family transcription factor [Parvibaculum sp.]
MVKYKNTNLDRTFSALADPTRRALLAQLDRETSLSVSELAAPFAMSLPAVMKHLDVLSDAGLITREKIGRSVNCTISPEPMAQAMDWLNHYQPYWTEKLDRLTAFLEEDQCPPSPPNLPNLKSKVIPLPRSNRASPSSGASKPTPPRSSPRGRTPKK